MVLLVTDKMHYGISPKAGISMVYLRIPNEKLSLPYGFPPFEKKYVTIYGKIVDISNLDTEEAQAHFNQKIKNREGEFLLVPSLFTELDFLYLSNALWEPIRDAGFVEVDHWLITVSLVKIIALGGDKPIYPSRTIK